MERKLLNVNLSLFEGEGGTAAAATTATGDIASSGVVPSSVAGKTRAKNPLADIKYGKQPDTVETAPQAADVDDKTPINTTSDTLEEKRAAYEKFKAEYKDMYDAEMQSIVKKRIGDTKQLEEANGKTKVILDILASRYGIKDAQDIEAITKAIEEDNSFYEQAAVDAGLTVEQYKRLQAVERENRILKEAREQAERRQQADQVYAGWLQESEQVKLLYPTFDLQAELQNPQFGKLLGNGVGVKAAFQALHHDEILSGAMQYTAQTIAKKTADGIANRQSRPIENGLNSQASANVKSDVSKLSRADRMEIARRAARGEQIKF